MHDTLRLSATIVVALALLVQPKSVTANVQPSALTLYALNCMGCHFPPEEIRREAPLLIGQFAQTEAGRVFFIRVQATGDKPLSKEQNVRLLREVLNWKKSCQVIIQSAPLIQYTGAR